MQLPIPCNVKRAMVGMSGDQVPNQSVLEAQMVRAWGCQPFLPHTTPSPACGLRLCYDAITPCHRPPSSSPAWSAPVPLTLHPAPTHVPTPTFFLLRLWCEHVQVVLCSDGKTVLATSWYPNRRGGRGGSPTAFLPIPHSIHGGIVSLAVGAAHTLLLGADGTVWSFGENDSGQLGRTTLNPEGGDSNVVQVPDIPDKVARVAAGESTYLAVRL